MPSRHFVSFLPALVLLGLALPTKLLAQPAACLEAAALVDTEGFRESPRDDHEAEMLALWYTEGLAAYAPLFERLHDDLDRFRMEQPDVELWEVWRDHVETTLIVRFVDAAASAEAEAGNNEAFNCLVDILGSDYQHYFAGVLASVVFEGRFDLERVAQLFELVPDVDYATPSYYANGLDTGCFHSPDGLRRVIFLEELVIILPAIGTGRILRIDVDPESGIAYEEYDHRTDAPWQDEYEACLDDELSGELDPDILGVLDIPTLSGIGLLVLVLSLLAAGVVRATRFP